MTSHIVARVRPRGLLLVLLLVVAALAAAVLGVFPAPVHAADHQFVVAIDAGHQARGISKTEPIGPGSRLRKPMVTSGTSGVATHKAESAINLQVALKLRALLERRGVKVVMIRTSQKVSISNSKRAQIANAANADLLIRLHCDAAGSKTRGVLTLVPGKNKWTGPILKPSARAGSAVHKAVLATTGAKNRGIRPRTDMSGFNWSTVPSVIVEMGVMTNRTDDRLLASSSYQTKLANGMANGIMTYLSAK
jgi:N-acetylmuramoyl-L-alanine amidase